MLPLLFAFVFSVLCEPLVFAGVSCPPDPPICPGNHSHINVAGDLCYIFFESKGTFNDAIEDCANVRGTLASIHNDFDNFLAAGFNPELPTWIGGYGTCKNVKWVDGSNAEYTKPLECNKPDQHGCLIINGIGGKWSFLPCKEMRQFLCLAPPFIETGTTQNQPTARPTPHHSTKHH